MSLKLGNDDVAKVMLGGQEVSAIYKGTDEVWKSEEDVIIGPIDNITEVFSAWPYKGTGGQIKLTTGTDLSKGGLVWFKKRNRESLHSLADTVRGREYYLMSHMPDAQFGPTADPNKDVISFDSDGLTIGEDYNASLNQAGRNDDYVVWSFQQRPGFMDIVEYEGTGAEQAIGHRLGCNAGMVLIKAVDQSTDWVVYNAARGPNYALCLNKADSERVDAGAFGDTWTEAEFSVGAGTLTNETGAKYIAYLFSGSPYEPCDDSIIKCGSYKGNGSTDGPEVDVGFEPQWLLFKGTSAGAHEAWTIFDTARGITNGGNAEYLMPDNDGGGVSQRCLDLTSNGFKIANKNKFLNASGENYIYMAIKADPNFRMPPEWEQMNQEVAEKIARRDAAREAITEKVKDSKDIKDDG